MALRQLANSTAQWGLRLRPSQVAFTDLAASLSRAFSVPADCKFMPSHEWAKVEGDTATIGVSDHAQSELGDVVYVELPEVGANVDKGATFGVVESVKAASDVYSPLTGEVVEINSAVVDEPALINTEPHGSGWLIKVKLSNPAEVGELLDAAAYEKHIES